jgi:excinuclease ABC subunit C
MSIRTQHEIFRDTLLTLPQKPGVYRYYDAADQLLYVGKAKNLKNRVSQYFQQKGNQNRRTVIMVERIARIEYTVVKTENDALLLEADLISKMQPQFNILLKDEKSYIYVEYDTASMIPTLKIARTKKNKNMRYIGPFFARYTLDELMRSLRIVLPWCQKAVYDGRPCEYVALGMCNGICTHSETIEDYKARLELIVKILEGDALLGMSYFENKIQESSGSNNFEMAAFWRDRSILMKRMITAHFARGQDIYDTNLDLDVVTLLLEKMDTGEEYGSIYVQILRRGRVVKVQNFLMTGIDGESEDEIITNTLSRFFLSYYQLSFGQNNIVVKAGRVS